MMPAALSAQPLLRLRDLRKTEGGPLGLSLDLAAGECLVLTGPAGPGPGCVLRLIAGLVRPDGGEILRGPGAGGIGVALCDQPPAMGLKLAAIVGAPLRAAGLSRGDAHAAALAALLRLGLAGQAEQAAGLLAPEALARLALARAIAGRPALVLLEEPFAGLDRPARLGLQMMWRALRAELGVATIHVTRDETEALLMGGRIGVLAGGALRQIGPPAALYDSPADAFVARFIGENNLLRGRIVDIVDDLAQVRLGCGPLVEARLADALPGQSCLVAIRPERVALAGVPAEEMGEGALPARLIETMFAGDHVRLRLEVGEPGLPPAPMLVKRPAGAPAMRAGMLSVAWRPHDAWAFAPVPGL